jgi:1-deoxy-D-xylulose-5-phosphate synthase
VGWPDQFIEHGSVPILREKYGMTAEVAARRILEAYEPISGTAGALRR